MAFPVVAATSTGQNDTSDITTHPVDLTGLGTISAGDKLGVIFDCYGAPGVTWPTVDGWSKDIEASRGTDITLSFGSYVASGGESSINVTTGSAVRSSYICFRLTGAGTVYVGTASIGSSTGPNAPALSGLASNDYLFLSPLAFQQNATVSSFPSNCSGNNLSIVGGGATSVTAAVATATSTGTSFDPFGYTMSSAFPYAAATIAIAPAAISTLPKGTLGLTGVGA